MSYLKHLSQTLRSQVIRLSVIIIYLQMLDFLAFVLCLHGKKQKSVNNTHTLQYYHYYYLCACAQVRVLFRHPSMTIRV